MSILLPRLDDRRWQDLRDEAVTLIPRHAPEWTDHNVTDPGITLLELMAYHAEAELFRLDQIGDAHYHAFLNLFGKGKLPSGPRPATTLVAYDPLEKYIPTERHVACGSYLVPRQPPSRYRATERVRDQAIPSDPLRQAGEPDEAMLHNDLILDRIPVPEFGFRSAHDLDLTRIRLGAVQAFDGKQFLDITEVLGAGKSVAVWGDNPQAGEDQSPDGPALYLGLDLKLFDKARPNMSNWALTLWFIPEGKSVASFINPESEEFSPNFRPMAPTPADQDTPTAKLYLGYDPARPPLNHHALTVRWEYLSGSQWKSVPSDGVFRDETRAFTLPGRVVIPGTVFNNISSKQAAVFGNVPAKHFYLRCRLASGRPDRAPTLCGIYADALLVEQWEQSSCTFSESSSRMGGMQVQQEMQANIEDAMADLARQGWERQASRWRDFDLKSLIAEWKDKKLVEGNTFLVEAIGVGTGLPGQRIDLPFRSTKQGKMIFSSRSQQEEEPVECHVIPETLQVWTLEPPWRYGPSQRVPIRNWEHRSWERVTDLGMHARNSEVYQYCPQLNEAQLSSPGYLLFADGETGRVPPNGSIIFASWRWTLADAANFAPDYLWALESDRDSILQDNLPRVRLFPQTRFRNVLSAEGGAGEEPLDHANDRLFREFEAARQHMADGLPVDTSFSNSSPPPMAVTAADFECLARVVPGTVVNRSKAWVEIDPRFPHVTVPGAVTVIILPELPHHQPAPTPGLLDRVKAWLLERRPLACRLSVVPPRYQPILLKATLHVQPGRLIEVETKARQTLTDYLHPLKGGSDQAGWPFGKHVHAGDLLRLLAGLNHVVHVTGLQISLSGVAWSDDLIRIPDMTLPSLLDSNIQFDMKEFA